MATGIRLGSHIRLAMPWEHMVPYGAGSHGDPWRPTPTPAMATHGLALPTMNPLERQLYCEHNTPVSSGADIEKDTDMIFTKNTTPSGATEYRSIVKTTTGLFAHWAQLDNERTWPNDFAVMIEGDRYIIGYMDHDEADADYQQVNVSDLPPRALAAILFAHSSEFDVSGDSGLDFAIN